MYKCIISLLYSSFFLCIQMFTFFFIRNRPAYPLPRNNGAQIGQPYGDASGFFSRTNDETLSMILERSPPVTTEIIQR